MIFSCCIIEINIIMNTLNIKEKNPSHLTTTNSTSILHSDLDPKLEKVFQTFNDFILTYHCSDEEEDVYIRQQWEGLKKVIEKDPGNIEAQYAYISNMLIKNPVASGPPKITVARR